MCSPHLGARVYARRVRWSITSQCQHMTTQDPAAAPHTLSSSTCGLEALDAGGQGAWASQASVPKRELARPQRGAPGRASAADPGERGVAARLEKRKRRRTQLRDTCTSCPSSLSSLLSSPLFISQNLASRARSIYISGFAAVEHLVVVTLSPPASSLQCLTLARRGRTTRRTNRLAKRRGGMATPRTVRCTSTSPVLCSQSLQGR